MASLHRGFPYKMFGLLTQTVLPQDIVETPDCMLDEFSFTLRQQHPDCQEPELLHVLEAHVMQAATTIASIESRHSTVRRQLVMRSVQCPTLMMHNLSAAWVMQNLRASTRSMQFRLTSKHGSRGQREVHTRISPASPPQQQTVSIYIRIDFCKKRTEGGRCFSGLMCGVWVWYFDLVFV